MSNKPGRPKKQLTENQKIEILNLYFSTELSKAEIATILKVADYRVSNFLSDLITTKKKVKESRKKEKNIDTSLILKLREQCYSSKDIAKELNIGDKLLKEICTKNNINLNIPVPKHPNVKGKVEEILEKFKNEISIAQLAKEYKVKSNVISKILKYNNVPVKRGLTKKQALNSKRYKHGLCSSKEWKIWQGIKRRCFNFNDHNYINYGARGITLYKDWVDDFESFYSYLESSIGLHPGEPYSLDRINNDGNYEPGNIRWATPKEQCRNMRKTVLTEDKVRLIRDTKKNGGSIRKLSKELGIDYSYAKKISRGMYWEEIQ